MIFIWFYIAFVWFDMISISFSYVFQMILYYSLWFLEVWPNFSDVPFLNFNVFPDSERATGNSNFDLKFERSTGKSLMVWTWSQDGQDLQWPWTAEPSSWNSKNRGLYYHNGCTRFLFRPTVMLRSVGSVLMMTSKLMMWASCFVITCTAKGYAGQVR